jgi:hypothetical protein
MSRDFDYVKPLSDEELYNQMNLYDRIKKGDLYIHRGQAVHVAIDSRNRVVAVRRTKDDAYNMACIRGCVHPSVIEGWRLSEEFIDKHNLLLDISLENRAKEDLERKTNKSD